MAEFNAALLEWANQDYERMERINADRSRQDVRVSLTDEERAFVFLTVYASGNENAALVRSIQTGKPREDAGFTGDFHLEEVDNNGMGAWCTLYYQASYHIADAQTLTVGERDRCVQKVMAGVQEFWESTGLEGLLKMDEEDVKNQLQAIAKGCSNGQVEFSIAADERQFQFEKMDERNGFGEI